MGMGNRLVVLFIFAMVVSLLLFSGCKGKNESGEVDLTTPPPLPDEPGAEGGEQPPVPPSSGEQQSAPGQQPAGLPLFG